MNHNQKGFNAASPALILVTGLPCSGKTTVALRLADDLGLPLVTKDDIKERLFDGLGWSDREWSRKLGGATYTILYYFIETLLKQGVSLVAESNFHPGSAAGELLAIQQRCPYQALVVECVTRAETLEERWRWRAEKSLRHPGHCDAEALEEFIRLVWEHTGADGYARLGAPPIEAQVVRVDTTFKLTQGYEAAVQAAHNFLGSFLDSKRDD